MAITPVTVTFSLHDFLGFVPDIRRTKVILTTNVDSGWIADTTTGGGFRITDARVTIDSAGLVSFSVLPSGATGLNPSAYQIHVRIDAVNPATRDREKVDLGWYTITAAANLKDLVSAQYVPPTYITQVTADLQAMIDQGLQGPQGIPGVPGPTGPPGGSDAATAGFVTSGPLTSAALATSFVHAVIDASGGVTLFQNGVEL